MASAGDTVRVLHWVYKIGDLKKSLDFYSQVFGIRVLRHEEFATGCEATCNGPYEGSWSKTMVGYGPEKDHFALELTHNYGIHSYEKGNDLRFIAIKTETSNEPFWPFRAEVYKRRAINLGYNVEETKEGTFIIGPDQQQYKLVNATQRDPFVFVSINVSDLERSKDYWMNVLGMREYKNIAGASPGKSIMLGFADDCCKLELVETPNKESINHKQAFGRIAFATRNGPQQYYEAACKTNDRVINTPITLTTPGKADVQVTILADRDSYEICFVEEVGFDDLCKLKPGHDFIDWEERDKMNSLIDKYAQLNKKQ